MFDSLPFLSLFASLYVKADIPRYPVGARIIPAPQTKCPRTRKVQRDYDRVLYKDRHLIENFFAKLKQYRAIATRYDKTACNFLGAIYGIASVILLN